MPNAAIVPPSPGPGARLKELLVEKFGSLTCRHRALGLVILRERMFLRCDDCGFETEGFTVPTVPLRGRP